MVVAGEREGSKRKRRGVGSGREKEKWVFSK